MARNPRCIPPGSIVHLISRFLNREYLITCEEERRQFLEFLHRAFLQSDWQLFSYAIMSTHAHQGTVAGRTPFCQLAKSVHSSFARWYNRRHGRLGPVFADRPRTILVDPADAGYLIAYMHNNPVRGGVVTEPAESTWTSHRAYLGQCEPSACLNVTLGLALAGFDVGSTDAFAAYVSQNAQQVDPVLSGHDRRVARRGLREAVMASIELGSPTADLKGSKLSYPIIGAEGVELAPRWSGPLDMALAAVASYTSVPADVIRSRSRLRYVTRARRLMVLVSCGMLGRRPVEVARYLNISSEGVRHHLHRIDDASIDAARLVAGILVAA